MTEVTSILVDIYHGKSLYGRLWPFVYLSPENSSEMSHDIGLYGHFLILPRDNLIEGKENRYAYSEDCIMMII